MKFHFVSSSIFWHIIVVHDHLFITPKINFIFGFNFLRMVLLNVRNRDLSIRYWTIERRFVFSLIESMKIPRGFWPNLRVMKVILEGKAHFILFKRQKSGLFKEHYTIESWFIFVYVKLVMIPRGFWSYLKALQCTYNA